MHMSVSVNILQAFPIFYQKHYVLDKKKTFKDFRWKKWLFRNKLGGGGNIYFMISSPGIIGVEKTGVLDEPTINLIRSPRCGIMDNLEIKQDIVDVVKVSFI